MAVRQTGMGLFHVSESQEARTEVYYQPLCDALVFTIVKTDPKEAVRGGYFTFSLPYLMFRQTLRGVIAVKATSREELIAIRHEVEAAQESLMTAFKPHCKSFTDFEKRLGEVADQAKRARKKTDIPVVRDAAREAWEEVCDDDAVGAFGPYGRRGEARGNNPLQAVLAAIAAAAQLEGDE